jgi:hypothetical protein
MPRKSPVKADPRVIWAQILPLIASGASLPAAVRQLPEPRPSLWWAKMAVRDDPDLAAKYRAAQEERADFLADQIVAVAEEQMPQGLSGPEASAWAQRQRLRVDAMKWTAAKLRPRVYGEHVSLDVAVDQRISIIGALEAAQRRVDTIESVEPEPAALLEDSRSRAKRVAAVPSER